MFFSFYCLFNRKVRLKYNNFVYSSQSFEDITFWLQDLKEKASSDIKIFIVGNKADLEKNRKITKEQEEQLKNNYDFDLFMETSVKTGFNIPEIFVQAAILLYKDYEKYEKNENLKKDRNVFPMVKKSDEYVKKINKCC